MHTINQNCVDCGFRSRAELCSYCTLARIEKAHIDSIRTLLKILRDYKKCAYCGEIATDEDHTVPKSLGGRFTIPSCSECNILASNTLHETLTEKRQYIKSLLRERYEKLLKAPVWDYDEINELGPTLRESVLTQEDARRIIIDRLKFFDMFDRTQYEVDSQEGYVRGHFTG